MMPEVERLSVNSHWLRIGALFLSSALIRPELLRVHVLIRHVGLASIQSNQQDKIILSYRQARDDDVSRR